MWSAPTINKNDKSTATMFHICVMVEEQYGVLKLKDKENNNTCILLENLSKNCGLPQEGLVFFPFATEYNFQLSILFK